MNNGLDSLKSLLVATCAFTATCFIGPVYAQSTGDAAPSAKDAPATPSEPQHPIGTLEPEIRVARSLNPASEPIFVRFLIHNKSDKPVELGAIPVLAGVSLPIELILGDADKPALFLTYKDEKPVPIRISDPQAVAGESQPLRIAPNGTVGTRVDLRDLYHNIRYAGQYKLEWRPLGGTIGSAVAALRVEPRKQAVIVTDYGNLTFELMYDRAPRNVENFLELARDGFYRDKTFHRVIPGFAIQGGCPNGNGTGVREDGKLIPAEFHDAEFKPGTLAMAHKSDDPNSASCQFFIVLDRLPELNGRYTVIGQASDDETLRALQQIAAVATDENDRPVRSLLIRSISLIDRDGPFAARRSIGRK